MADWPYNTAQWKRLRKAKLSLNPLCEPCLKREKLVLAAHVDHIVSIASGGAPFPALHELMAMCASCHSVKTQAIDNPRASRGQAPIAYKGAGVDGLPIDPSHPFFGQGIGGAGTSGWGQETTWGSTPIVSLKNQKNPDDEDRF